MTLCPVALAVGCEKCPLFKICPLKTVIGNQEKEKMPYSYVRTAHGGKYWKPQKKKKDRP
jgi:hypothetical protein